jgi:hypothetical protein
MFKPSLTKAGLLLKHFFICPGGAAQWTSHLPQEQEDPGSNPARV